MIRMSTIQFKRGLSANLPVSAANGEPIFATDTGRLYIGTGSALVGVNADSGVTSVAGRTGNVVLSVADVTGAAALASPTFTGTPRAPTNATASASTTQIATTAFVHAAIRSDIPMESGTWVPMLTCRSGGTPPTYTQGGWMGEYMRIGNMVYITCTIRPTITNAGTGYAAITGLPFASSLTTSWAFLGLSMAECYFIVSEASDLIGRVATIHRGTTQIWIQGSDGAYAKSWITGSGGISLSGWYRINS